MSPEVQRRLGNEKEGGYAFKAKAPCIDGTLNDQQVLERFLAHRKKTCPCYVKEEGARRE